MCLAMTMGLEILQLVRNVQLVPSRSSLNPYTPPSGDDQTLLLFFRETWRIMMRSMLLMRIARRNMREIQAPGFRARLTFTTSSGIKLLMLSI